MPFFPEYTDHSDKHVEEVLVTADAIITDAAHERLKPRDAGILVLAILLHDLGMHISEDGFASLISADQEVTIKRLDNKKWHELWEEFFSEAKRFDGKTLNRLFGSADPVRRPPADKQELTRRDRLLIGEFLRRNHARLAHEIALVGFPGPEDKRLHIGTEVDEKLRDLAGLVARSHNYSVREMLPDLRDTFHERDYKGIHAVFLMVVLRIADYLQVQEERAPSSQLLVSKLRTPVSQREWKAHAAVENITLEHDDPEAIFVKASPPDVGSYLRLRQTLSGLQTELDTSWAVLGEVYGRFKGLSDFGIALRRVRSNLDDTAKLAAQMPYVPCEAQFRAADAELLKLLAEPLYGTEPHYAVRELIQNAVDAVLELSDTLKHSGDPPPKERSHTSDVKVELRAEKEGSVLEVSDCGIGMTKGVLLDYFLKAGASYRRSDEWKGAHEDPSGHSRVLRSGRFGIGALAAFILGNDISVSTRHVHDTRGLQFSGNLDSEHLELRYIDRTVGTTVSIQLKEEIAERLRGEMELESFVRFGQLPGKVYLLDRPSLEMRVNAKKIDLGPRWPGPDTPKVPPGWNRIIPPTSKKCYGALWTEAANSPAMALPCARNTLGQHGLSFPTCTGSAHRSFRFLTLTETCP